MRFIFEFYNLSQNIKYTSRVPRLCPGRTLPLFRVDKLINMLNINKVKATAWVFCASRKLACILGDILVRTLWYY